MREGRVRLGIVGTGKLGTIHTRLAAGLADAELIGVFDVDREKGSELARAHRVRPFDSLEGLLGEVDGCVIVTPTSTHLDVARRALAAGVDCFIEKPVAGSVAEAEELLRIASGTNRIVQVGHVERFNPAFLAAGNRPKPLFIEAHRLARFTPRATDVAVVFDLMIHDIDLVLTMLPGEDPVEIRASGVSILSDEIDIANARIEFPGGCVANLTASRISRSPMRKMRVFGDRSYISWDFAEPSVEIFSVSSDGGQGSTSTPDVDPEVLRSMLGEIDAGTRNLAISYQRPPIPEINPIGRELELFVESIRTRTAPPVTLEEGVRAVKIAEEIVSLILKGRTSG